MHQTAIFGPFFATMFLTMSVWVYMSTVAVWFMLIRAALAPIGAS